MTKPTLRSPFVLTGLAIGGLVLVGVSLFGILGPASRTSLQVAEECSASRSTAERVAPLAKGELAALAVTRVSKPPPEIAFQSPANQPMGLGDLKPKTILVNLWATWCVPCREEMPALDKLQAELGGAEFEVVAINVDTRNPDKPRAWLQENRIHNLAYYADPSGKLLQVLQRSGHVVGLPTTLLVDAAGCEIGVIKGPAEWASPDAFALIRAALGRPS
jgi:thiol-disulfide isomerase/thioredoxin